MTPLLAFFIGLFAGVIVSVFTFSLFSASQKADDNAERAMKILEDEEPLEPFDPKHPEKYCKLNEGWALTNINQVTNEKGMEP
jgi:hypothetical protein